MLILLFALALALALAATVVWAVTGLAWAALVYLAGMAAIVATLYVLGRDPA